jgi:hypothetical protein
VGLGPRSHLVGRGSQMSETYLQSSRIGLALEFAESEPLPSRALGVVLCAVWYRSNHFKNLNYVCYNYQILPQRRHPAKGIIEDDRTPTLIFLTVCTAHRRPWLADPHVHKALVQIWRSATHWQVGPYILMPDHIHLFARPGGSSATFDRVSARQFPGASHYQAVRHQRPCY